MTAVEEEDEDGDGDGDAPGEVDLKNEVLSFPTNCPDCNAPAATNMKMTCKSLVASCLFKFLIFAR